MWPCVGNPESVAVRVPGDPRKEQGRRHYACVHDERYPGSSQDFELLFCFVEEVFHFVVSVGTPAVDVQGERRLEGSSFEQQVN